MRPRQKARQERKAAKVQSRETIKLAKIAKKRSETDIDIDKQEKEEISLRKKPLEYKIKDTTNKQNFDENSTSNDKNNNDKNKKVKSDKQLINNFLYYKFEDYLFC